MSRKYKPALPQPALVVACLALAVALSGPAVAAGIVANARHANRADIAARALSADRLQGRTAVQIATAGAQAGAQLPGPASTARSLDAVKTVSAGEVSPGGTQTFVISCDEGAKVMGGGYSTDSPMLVLHSYPSSDTTWSVALVNTDTQAAHSVSLYATCLK
jgi:hypothetical protein